MSMTEAAGSRRGVWNKIGFFEPRISKIPLGDDLVDDRFEAKKLVDPVCQPLATQAFETRMPRRVTIHFVKSGERSIDRFVNQDPGKSAAVEVRISWE